MGQILSVVSLVDVCAVQSRKCIGFIIVLVRVLNTAKHISQALFNPSI